MNTINTPDVEEEELLPILQGIGKEDLTAFVTRLNKVRRSGELSEEDYPALRRQVLKRAEQLDCLPLMEDMLELYDSLFRGYTAPEEDFSDLLHYDHSGKPNGVKCAAFAERFREKERIIREAEGRELFKVYYRYREGCYHRISDETLRADVAATLRRIDPQLVRMRDVDEITRLLLTAAEPVQRNELNDDENIVCFRNGIYRLSDGELLEHSPDRLTTVQLNAEYRVTAPDCPVFMKFIDRLTGGIPERRQYLLAYMGAIFSNVRGSRLKKALLIVGPGNTGKSRLLNLIRAILGERNCCTLDLKTLEEDRFASAQLFGRRLMTDSDMSVGTISSLDTFKKLTGGDSVYAQEKGQTPFTFEYKGLMCFSMNELPKFGGDKGDWVYERMAIVYCTGAIPKEETDPFILEKMLAERDHIATLCINAFAEQFRQYGTIPEPGDLKAARQFYRAQNSPVLRFFYECCELRPANEPPHDRFSTAKLYEYFKNWCRDNGVCRRVGKTEFRREIAEALHKPVSELIRHMTERNYYIFTLKEEYQQEYMEE